MPERTRDAAGPTRSPALSQRRSSHESATSGALIDGLGAIKGDDLSPNARAMLQAAIQAGEGLILICGAAGSAKPETMRGLARDAAGVDGEIVRFEAPDARERLRKRPGAAVAIGEIRDAESAEAAVRLAMIGGLVIATLDSATAAGAPDRLVALGVPPYALASSLRVAITQQLAHHDCLRCAQTGQSASGVACAECEGLGSVQRVTIPEGMALDDSLRALILAGAPEAALRHAMASAAPGSPPPRRRRDRRAVQRITNAATVGAYGFGAP